MTCVRCGAPLGGRQTKYCRVGCKTADAIDERRREFKRRAIALKGGKCQRCGYDRCENALTFHHRDEKAFPIANMYRYSWAKVLEELATCDLLCANCHAEEHAEQHRLESNRLDQEHSC